MSQIEDLRLTGEYVSRLPDKSFTIMKMNKQKMLGIGTNEEIEKYVITVKLANERIRDWIPNKTSLQVLADRFSDNTDDFIGKKAKFKIVEQKVRGNLTKVIYIE